MDINGMRLQGTNIYGQPPLAYITANLVANYSSAPSVGSTWTDTSGNGRNINIVNQGSGNTAYTSSYGGGITVLTKNVAYFDTGIVAGTLGNNFTISMAAQFNISTTYWATWWGDDYYSGYQGYFGYQSSSSAITFGSVNGPATVVFNTIGANIANVNIWDFTISGTQANIYLNGVSAGNVTITAPSSVGTANLYFGARHQNVGGGYTDTNPGTYYSMRVYNTALNYSQIQTNYQTLKGTYGLP